jgi:hypothetical protein
MQAFEVALGLPRSEFVSHTARRHLGALGFKLHGDIEHRDGTVDRPQGDDRPKRAFSVVPPVSQEWHTEEAVQAALVTWLASQGYSILSVANTATKQHGVDVIARREITFGFEVKGFPSKGYADPRRADEVKRTSPSTQAGHWYSQAILAAMRLRGREPEWKSCIALPDFPRYRDLYAETSGSLIAAEIAVYFVREDGSVTTA